MTTPAGRPRGFGESASGAAAPGCLPCVGPAGDAQHQPPLKSGARLKDSVIQTRRVRAIGDKLRGFPHPACDSCKAVFRQFRIKYME
jgi:hypothetical protein